MVNRSNGSDSYSSNIPIAHIKDLEWEKGDNLTLEVGKVRDRDVIIIFNDRRDDGVSEEPKANPWVDRSIQCEECKN